MSVTGEDDSGSDSVENTGSGSVTLIAVVREPTGRMDMMSLGDGEAVVSGPTGGPSGVTTGSEDIVAELDSSIGVGVT